MAIGASRLYLCTDARTRQADFSQFVDAAFAGGVDIIQLRDASLEAADELEALVVLAEAAERHGKLWAVNNRADIAAASRAPVLHLGQRDLPRAAARSIIHPTTAMGLSTHTRAQVDAALADDLLDYYCVGPVWATPTKPGRDAVGVELVEYAASRASSPERDRPWFAIGAIDLSTVSQVVDSGARRIVVVRAITEASDPAEAARRLCAALPDLY